MARTKRTSSKVIQNAAARAAGLESIDPSLDLGNNQTIAAYKAAITDTQTKQSDYNTLLSQADEAKDAFDAAEAKLDALSGRMLAAAAAKYGRDSIEYEQAGGVRTSARKRRSSEVASEAKKAA